MKALQIAAYTILGLLLVPPALFLAFYFAMGGTQADSGHPPAIVLPYLYLILGFRFLGPVGAAVSFWAASLAFSRALPAWTGYRLLALGTVFAIGCAAAWLHQFV
jgi:hypothetical protein